VRQHSTLSLAMTKEIEQKTPFVLFSTSALQERSSHRQVAFLRDQTKKNLDPILAKDGFLKL
jgi:hypothetical protein